MDPLQLRENEIFSTLKRLKRYKFVVIGGYAVNAYTLPRFSVDCDIVVADGTESSRIGKVLLGLGYKNIKHDANSSAKFVRYDKTIADSFKVSLDILIGAVLDRQTNVYISANWVFKNSRIKLLKGKTIVEKLRVRIVDSDALFVMKMISCRSTDIRDIFMIAPIIEDRNWIREEISSRYNLDDRLRKVKAAVSSTDFRNGLQSVYGLIDDQTFKKSMKAIDSLDSF
ncbi:MAG: hypothetical protein ACREBH_00360 [Candidatus Micrarchaeaceae archaeon]